MEWRGCRERGGGAESVESVIRALRTPRAALRGVRVPLVPSGRGDLGELGLE